MQLVEISKGIQVACNGVANNDIEPAKQLKHHEAAPSLGNEHAAPAGHVCDNSEHRGTTVAPVTLAQIEGGAA